MFDTYVTIVGTALQTPERKLIEKSNAVVASFRVVTNARRFDRENQVWVDGANLRIKVNCWRRLADGVVGSVFSGDPVVVHGRISTREWKNEQGETRIAYEVDADTVGHDLSRGSADFHKMKPDTVRSVIEDEDSESRVNGELTRAVPVPGSGSIFGHVNGDRPGGEAAEEPYHDFGYGESYNGSDVPDTDVEAMAILRNAGLDPTKTDEESGGDDTDEGETAGADAGSGGSGSRSRRRGRQPVPA
jgi:single-strand DNA-binding protein